MENDIDSLTGGSGPHEGRECRLALPGFGIVIRRQIDVEDADGIAAFQELSNDRVTEITCSTGN